MSGSGWASNSSITNFRQIAYFLAGFIHQVVLRPDPMGAVMLAFGFPLQIAAIGLHVPSTSLVVEMDLQDPPDFLSQ